MTAQHQVRGDVAVLVAAAGFGTRLGPGAPKALREVGGASLLVHAVGRIARARGVGCVVVAAPPGAAATVRTLLAELAQPDAVAKVATTEIANAEVANAEVANAEVAAAEILVVEGGATRQESVAAALAAVPAGYPIILVHDAARALVPRELVERVADAVRAGHDAVIPVLSVIDTIKQVDADGYVVATPDRATLRAVQTPQGFRRSVLQQAHDQATGSVTDDAGLVELLGLRVFCVPGAEAAMKITRPADLATAERLLAADTLGS